MFSSLMRTSHLLSTSSCAMKGVLSSSSTTSSIIASSISSSSSSLYALSRRSLFSSSSVLLAEAKTAAKPAASKNEKKSEKKSAAPIPAAPAAPVAEKKPKVKYVVPKVPKGPWTEDEIQRLMRLAQRLDAWKKFKFTGSYTQFYVPQVYSWNDVASKMEGRTVIECKKKFEEIEAEADLVGAPAFLFHPSRFYPEYPSGQARRWLISYAYNFISVKGSFDGPSKRASREDIHSFVRSIEINSFYFRKDTFFRILETDGAKLFDFKGDDIYIKAKIDESEKRRISHLIYDPYQLEKDIVEQISSIMSRKSRITFRELKGMLQFELRMSETHFKLLGGFKKFIESNREVFNMIELIENKANKYDPLVRFSSKRQIVVEATAAPTSPTISGSDTAAEPGSPSTEAVTPDGSEIEKAPELSS